MLLFAISHKQLMSYTAIEIKLLSMPASCQCVAIKLNLMMKEKELNSYVHFNKTVQTVRRFALHLRQLVKLLFFVCTYYENIQGKLTGSA